MGDGNARSGALCKGALPPCSQPAAVGAFYHVMRPP